MTNLKNLLWAKADQLLQQALDLAPEMRPAFLDQMCGADRALRDEVDSLIAAHESAGGFLETPFFGDRNESLAGRRIGPYRLLREIGRGGMGTVYLAERADEEFRQQVAIKLIGREIESEDVRRRFLEERQILARLSHPNIARLLDGGTTEDGAPYLVMEFIEGKPIDEYCKEHGLPVRERLRLFQKVCDAAQYSHQNLVLHRDLKPQNILVTADSTPKLLDFGIAKLLDPARAATEITQTGQRMMTPEYASPEQIRGDSISMASDVYALGVLLYRLLTGVRPYHLAGHSPHELAQAICEQEPARASGRVKEPTLRRALASDLDDIILKALRKEPTARYASVEQFAEDIRRHLAGLPVLARRGTVTYRTGKFIRRHRGALATVALVALVLCSVIVSLYSARRAEAAEAREEYQRAVAEAQHLRAEREQTKSEVAQSQAEAQRLRTQQAQAQATSQNARAEGLLLDLRLLTSTMLHEAQTEIIKLPGSLRARELLIRRALEYLDRLTPQAGHNPALRRELAAAYERAGDLLGNSSNGDLGDWTGALGSYRRALALRQILPRAGAEGWRDRYNLIVNYRKLGNVLRVSQRHKEAADSYSQALALIEDWTKARPQDERLRKQEVLIHRQLGTLLRLDGDKAGAQAHTRKAKTLLESLLSQGPLNPWPDEWGTGREYDELGILSRELGDLDQALCHFQRYLAMVEAELATSRGNAIFRRNFASAQMRVGDVLLKLDRHGEAAQHFRQALTIYEELSAQDPENARERRIVSNARRQLATALKESKN